LKKAFSSKLHKDEMVTVNEYCPDCSSPFDDDTKNAREYCGRPKSKREKNYFLTLDIGEQIQNMFEGKLLF
jgi:ribosomal protein S27AE